MSKLESITAGTATGQGQSSQISAEALAWASEARKISQETLELLGVASGTASFRNAGKSAAIFFPYSNGWKARAFPAKDFTAKPGWVPGFWNLDRVLTGKLDVVYVVEGEMDALAMVEAGVPPDRVLSVPNGAPQKPTDNPKDQRGYGYVDEALRAGLSKAKKIVWCGDSDGNGLALRSDMVKLFGAARFWFVDWPEGIKDANEFLIKDGAEALLERVTDGALPWPVDGLYRLSELPEPPPLSLWKPGFDEWESKVMLAPRTLSVVTGHPNHGKTAMWCQIWFQVVKTYGIPICVASFETRAKPHIRRQIRSLLAGKLERDMTEAEKAQADDWIEDRYLFPVHPEGRPTLSWFLDKAEIAVIRHGARIIQLDPWNRLEGSRTRDESETDYIGRCLREIHLFAHDMNVHVQILAHPAKMEGARRGQPPGLEDISGSKHWENMVDQGFVVHRPEMYEGTKRKTEAALICRKARFEELGHPCKLRMDFDVSKGSYRSIDYDVGYV